MAVWQRWRALTLSLVLHVGVIGFIVWVDAAFPPQTAPFYEIAATPDQPRHDPKIIWYDFRKKLPEITPEHRFGPAKTPQGEQDPTQTLITVSPKAPSTKQLIRQPDHPEPLPADLPAPNLVAVKVKLPPKAFVPPPKAPSQPKAAVTKVIDSQSSLDTAKLQTGSALGAIATLQKLPPKPFVAPTAEASPGRIAAHVDAPTASSFDVQANPVSGLQGVIIGLNPGTALPPPGSRSAQIAKAPEAGTPSSGIPLASATAVPSVLSRGKPGELPAPVPVPAAPIPERGIPKEVVLPGVNRSVSAPLRPSSRVIPATVEARFAHRDVYTLVIPGPALQGYGGDWVMWFAERNPPEMSSGPRILAPIPARKFSAAAANTDGSGIPVSATFQFAASIDKAGHIGSVVVLRGSADPALRLRVVEEMGSWEFKPALRNGEPVEADVVVEIPFRLPPGLPQSLPQTSR